MRPHALASLSVAGRMAMSIGATFEYARLDRSSGAILYDALPSMAHWSRTPMDDVPMSPNGMVRPCKLPTGRAQNRSTAMPRSTNLSVATMGIDIGKNSLHVVGLDRTTARPNRSESGFPRAADGASLTH